MKKYNCTVRVINQKSEIMFREVPQNGVFKLISFLFLSLTDESDFSLKSFFFHLFYTCLLSLVYEVGCRAAKIFFFSFFFKTYMSIIKSQLFLTTQNVIRHFWYLLSFLQLSLHFKVFKALCEASVKILLHFVSISLILTNDWQLLQICKHLLTCSPRQWWVHKSLVSPYCLTYLC